MNCPTCQQRMKGVADSPPLLWCLRCGTLYGPDPSLPTAQAVMVPETAATHVYVTGPCTILEISADNELDKPRENG